MVQNFKAVKVVDHVAGPVESHWGKEVTDYTITFTDTKFTSIA